MQFNVLEGESCSGFAGGAAEGAAGELGGVMDSQRLWQGNFDDVVVEIIVMG